MTREAELDALMSRLARGDRAAFDPLYAALRPRALRLASSRLGAERAADVAQSAMMKVFAAASEFDPTRPCLPWFYALVTNEIRAAARRDARLVPREIGEDTLVDERDAETELVERELSRAVDVALASLDTEAAAAIHAFLGRGPLPDVAPPAFRKRVSRAYAKLRLLLGGHDAS